MAQEDAYQTSFLGCPGCGAFSFRVSPIPAMGFPPWLVAGFQCVLEHLPLQPQTPSEPGLSGFSVPWGALQRVVFLQGLLGGRGGVLAEPADAKVAIVGNVKIIGAT